MTLLTTKFNLPRHPIAIIGGGMAGLAAAARLWDYGAPAFILERFGKCGGRFNSRRGEGWVADHGTPFFTAHDERLLHLIRWCGLDKHRTVIQGGIHTLRPDGTVQAGKYGGIDPSRLCIDEGFGLLTERLANTFDVRYNTGVGAIRWDNDEKTFWWDKEGQVFWFEDEAGEPVRNEVTKQPLIASGVILATTPTAAARIAAKSRTLEKIRPLLDGLKYDQCFTAMFRVPKAEVPFWALKGIDGARIKWLSFEDRKAPERANDELSLIVVQASPEWSAKLMAQPEGDALYAVYQEIRSILPMLPDKPGSQTYKRWNVARLASAPLGTPAELGLENGLWPINPSHAPFALAGDYVLDGTIEGAVRSGELAAYMVLGMQPKNRRVLGLELRG